MQVMNQLRMKVIVLGEKRLVKHTFLTLWHENASSMYLPTIGVDMFVYRKEEPKYTFGTRPELIDSAQ